MFAKIMKNTLIFLLNGVFYSIVHLILKQIILMFAKYLVNDFIIINTVLLFETNIFSLIKFNFFHFILIIITSRIN